MLKVGVAVFLAAVLAVVTVSVAPPSASAASTTEQVLERQLLEQLNQERAARGVGPVSVNNDLVDASRHWSGWMSDRSSLQHSTDGRAEIIARGWWTGQITNAWMKSSGHRNLMVDPNLTLAGVGVVCDGDGQMWATIQFLRADRSKGTLNYTEPEPAVTSERSGSDCGDGHLINQVRRLYAAYFRRNSDLGGLAYWVTEMTEGTSLGQVSSEFAASREFRETYGSLGNAAFLDLVYQNVMGRGPDAGGRAYWLRRLNSGLSRGDLMIGFSESPEFKSRSGIG